MKGTRNGHFISEIKTKEQKGRKRAKSKPIHRSINSAHTHKKHIARE